MVTQKTLVRELNRDFELYESDTGSYEVLPKEDGWSYIYRGNLGSEVKMSWMFLWGEDTCLFTLEEVNGEEKIQLYKFDFWSMLNNEIENREVRDTFSVTES